MLLSLLFSIQRSTFSAWDKGIKVIAAHPAQDLGEALLDLGGVLTGQPLNGAVGAARQTILSQLLTQPSFVERAKQYDRAVKDLDEVIKHHPKEGRAYRQRGLAYNAINQYERAVSDFNVAQKLNAKDVEVYYHRGLAYRRLGKNELAVQDYSEAIKLEPKNAESYNNRANAYSLLGKFENAVKDYDEAIKLDGKNAKIYANRGVILARLGKHDDAQKDLKKALELDPSLKEQIEPFMSSGKR